jgi:hypothetical protein
VGRAAQERQRFSQCSDACDVGRAAQERQRFSECSDGCDVGRAAQERLRFSQCARGLVSALTLAMWAGLLKCDAADILQLDVVDVEF